LAFADQRREPLSQLCGLGFVEAMVDLAGIDQVIALAPAEIDAVPFLPSSAKPAMVSVSRCAQVFLTQSSPRPEA
jgi:hypothetical protein